MTKYTPPPLKDDETRMKPYDKLSRGAKQEMDLARRAAVKEKQKAADAGDSVGKKVSDGVAALLYASPLNPNSSKDLAGLRGERDGRKRKREDELQSAKDAADYKDTERKGNLYGDMAPGKMKDAGYAKGGKVTGFKGYGKAKKV